MTFIKEYDMNIVILYILVLIILFHVINLISVYINSLSIQFYNDLFNMLSNDKEIYDNFSSRKTIHEIFKIRKKSKYKKKGYGGHPLLYTFSYPLDNKIVLHPHLNFKYIDILVFIHSRPDEFYERFLSRKCISISKKFYVIYITSRSKTNEVNNKLKYESFIYNDILQFNELASYFNLTIQSLHMLLWSINIKYKYLVKTDVDVYINATFIIKWLSSSYFHFKYYSMGRISITNVIRNKKYSHYVPVNVISDKYYPPYLQGVGYIIPYNTVKLLCKTIKYVKPKIWIEDVYMGYLYKYNNVNLIDMSKYIIRDISLNAKSSLHNLSNYMLIHGLYPMEIVKLKQCKI